MLPRHHHLHLTCPLYDSLHEGRVFDSSCRFFHLIYPEAIGTQAQVDVELLFAKFIRSIVLVDDYLELFSLQRDTFVLLNIVD